MQNNWQPQQQQQNIPQWNNQWNQEGSLGQQNQFPFPPVQNQAPIVFPQPQQQQPQPWYMPEEPKWNNDWAKQDNLPMQPHPTASQIQWVDRTAGEENQGIDNFEKQVEPQLDSWKAGDIVGTFQWTRYRCGDG